MKPEDANDKPPPRDFRKEATDDIIRMLEQGTAPWQKPWESGEAGRMPYNPNTNKPYRGGLTSGTPFSTNTSSSAVSAAGGNPELVAPVRDSRQKPVDDSFFVVAKHDETRPALPESRPSPVYRTKLQTSFGGRSRSVVILR
jgi:hypothetical protein